MRKKHQTLPTNWKKRELLREKGQFWTPNWVAEAMVSYALGRDGRTIFDPAVGGGAFLLAAKHFAQRTQRKIELCGCELYAESLREALASGLDGKDLSAVEIRDFVLNPPEQQWQAVVANPPYIRHHRLGEKLKQDLRLLAKTLIGKTLDGRAGYHVYFLLRGLQSLSHGGRLAFIMPADTCEGVFAVPLWNWITTTYRLDGVVTFSTDATPFPSVDTNAVVFFIRRESPCDMFHWCRCLQPESTALREWVQSEFRLKFSDLEVFERRIPEGLETGLSRPPVNTVHEGPVLKDYATVLRGIATGANEFFFLTRQQAADLEIPLQFFKPAVGRTRDVQGDVLSTDDLSRLDAEGRPTFLLSLDARDIDEFPGSVQRYLQQGVELGIADRVLIASRKPWYKMETRSVPPFLFAYLGRRNARFIRNKAGALPLTGFLCVYPRTRDADSIERLWRILTHPDTIANLQLVGKSYGAGAIKVEPRALERLPIPKSALGCYDQEHKIGSTRQQLSLI